MKILVDIDKTSKNELSCLIDDEKYHFVFSYKSNESKKRIIKNAKNLHYFRADLYVKDKKTLAKLKEYYLKSFFGYEIYKTKNEENFSPDNQKLAYFSPLPNIKSGISYYSVDILSELKKYYEIIIIVENLIDIDENLKNEYDIKDISYFYENHMSFTRVLYHFGNSHFHSYMVEAMKIKPGIVVLHDFFIGDLYEWRYRKLDKNIYDELYNSYGYSSINEKNYIAKYPFNKTILNQALSIIVHSEFAKNLANEYYPNINKNKFFKVNLARKFSGEYDKKSEKKKLGFLEDEFLICVFGIIQELKMTKEIAQAFKQSKLFSNPKCKLIFVGEVVDNTYGYEFIKFVKDYKNIKITNWLSDDEYESYLKSADMAVGLRKNSRGESSASLLDCMNYMIATIVNKHGSSAEIDANLVHFINDEFSIDELKNAIEYLYENENYRQNLAKNARSYIKNYHSIKNCVNEYVKIIEKSYNYTNLNDKFELVNFMNDKNFNDILKDIANIIKNNEIEILKKINHKKIKNFYNTIKAIATLENNSSNDRVIFVDISAIVIVDLKTGIQRVVKKILKELIKIAPKNIRIEPVYISNLDNHKFYKYARNYMCSECSLKDEIINLNYNDIILILDFNMDFVIKANENKLFDYYSNLGAKFYTIVYDLLPVKMPQFFPKISTKEYKLWFYIVAKKSSLIGISNAVKDDINEYLESDKITNKPKTYSIKLGANFNQKNLSLKIPENLEIYKNALLKPTFLMVGTLEPRKGHLSVLRAFDEIWQSEDVNLIIIGKEGWMIDETRDYILNHDLLNEKLFWEKNASDELLEYLYQNASCLISASYGEGFGLPLIEAAMHKLPLFIRNIKVFNEVAGEFAFYFQDDDTIAEDILKWLEDFRQNKHIKSNNLPYNSWQNCANELLEILIKDEI